MSRTALRPAPMAIGNGALNAQSGRADASENKRSKVFAQGIRRARRSKPKLQTIVNAQVRRVLVDRYGACLPDDDAGRSDLFIAVQVLASTGTGEPNVRIYIRAVAPWLGEAETDKMVDRVYRKLLRYRPDTLGRALHVTDAQRTRLKIWNIGAVDVPNEVRDARRKAKKLASQTARRRQLGARPQAESISAKRPWEALGMSRRTWYRKGKPAAPNRGTDLKGDILPHGCDFKVVPTPAARRARAKTPGRAPTARKKLAPLAAALSHETCDQKGFSGKKDFRPAHRGGVVVDMISDGRPARKSPANTPQVGVSVAARLAVVGPGPGCGESRP